MLPGAFKTWMSNISKGLSRLPRYCSPEYYNFLAVKRSQSPETYTEVLKPTKHDVFCLGLVLLQLATLEDCTVIRNFAFAVQGI